MLLQCPECSNSVSDQAPSCPKCGVPLDVAGNKLKAKPSRTLIFSLVVPLLYVSINSFSILDQRSKFEEYVRSENNPMFNYEGTGLAPGALEYAKNAPNRESISDILDIPIPRIISNAVLNGTVTPPLWSVLLQGIWLWVVALYALFRPSWKAALLSAAIPGLIIFALSFEITPSIFSAIMGLPILSVVWLVYSSLRSRI